MNELLSSVPLTATSTHCGSGRKGAGKSKVKLAYNDGAPEPMAAGSGSGVDHEARLLEAFIESLVFFPELGDIAVYNWSA